jgi:transposase, IS5 family
MGVFYAVLDKAARGKNLSRTQKKRNKKISSIKAAVKHVFGFMNKKLKVTTAAAKTKLRNVLRFDMQCNIYNVCRASFLLKRKIAKTELYPSLCERGKKTKTNSKIKAKDD